MNKIIRRQTCLSLACSLRFVSLCTEMQMSDMSPKMLLGGFINPLKLPGWKVKCLSHFKTSPVASEQLFLGDDMIWTTENLYRRCRIESFSAGSLQVYATQKTDGAHSCCWPQGLE